MTHKLFRELIDMAPDDLRMILPRPEPFVNSGGGSMNSGFRDGQEMEGMIYAISDFLHGDFAACWNGLQQLEHNIAVRKASIVYFSNIFKHSGPSEKTLYDRLLGIHCDYFGLKRDELPRRYAAAREDADKLWGEMFPGDEEGITEERLIVFYNSLPPEYASSSLCFLDEANTLSSGFRALPVMAAAGLKSVNAFDFGGNDGLTAAALAGVVSGKALLVDASRALLDFARYRNKRLNITNVECAAPDKTALAPYRGQFDFGVCTEVLEHVFDVHETVGMLQALLKPGGILFASTSFGNPMPSHLIKNRQYFGREIQLFAEHDLHTVEMAGLPFMMPGTLILRRA